MRILFCPHAYYPVFGGTEILCQRVAEGLDDMGHDVRVLTADVGSVEAYYQFGIRPFQHGRGSVNGVDVVRVRYGGLLYTYLGGYLTRLPESSLKRRFSSYLMRLIRWRFTKVVTHEIHSFQPDVVVVMPHLVVNVQAVLSSHRSYPFPLVMLPLLHEESPDWDVSSVRAALTQADAVIALTEFEGERLIDGYSMDAVRVFVSGCGVDLPLKWPIAEKQPLILFLGRKTPSKGILLLLEAMRNVWTTHPVAKLVLAGARTCETQPIDKAICALPVQERKQVESLDNISEEEKLELLGRARCLVLPSTNESFGVVLLEAWSNGTAVITLDLPIFRELVDEKIDGLLVKPDDSVEMASAICWMLDHQEEANRMGQNGAEKVKARFSWPHVTERFADACQYAIRHPCRSGR